MDTTMASAPGHSERMHVRLAAALALSIACHVVAALVLGRGLGGGVLPRPPIIVTMLEQGGGAGGAAGGPAAAVPAATLPESRLEAKPEPAAVPKPIARQRTAPAELRSRRDPTRGVREQPVQPAVAAAVPAGAAATAPAVPHADTGGPGANGDGNGAGAGMLGAGRGSQGAGTGADGLRAYCRSCPVPDYPPRARRQGWHGTVDVALRIGRDGSVAAASVERSSGYPTLDDVALASARASRFAIPEGGAGLDGQLRYRFVLDQAARRP